MEGLRVAVFICVRVHVVHTVPVLPLTFFVTHCTVPVLPLKNINGSTVTVQYAGF